MSFTIPRVDLSHFVSSSDANRARFVKDLGSAFSDIGFVAVKNHGVSKDLINRFFRMSHDFFALPVETKLKYEIENMGGQRGYTSFGREHAKYSDVPDLKEFYQVGQVEVSPDLDRADYPDNIPVAELPDFLPLGVELYRAFEHAGGALLRAIALYLDLPENYFEPKVSSGNSILRTIFYPPITQEPKSAIRSEAHEDINLITLLVGASAGGLELMNKEDQWVPIVPENDEMVINVGDMLQRLTNNVLRSTTHRVINPPRSEWHTSRLSIPFFLHPRSDMDLTCLPHCITKDNPVAYTPTTAGEYLDERLREIGLRS